VQTFQPDATPFAFALRHDVPGFLAGSSTGDGSSRIRPFRILLHSSSRDLTRTTSVARCGSSAGRSRPRGQLLGPAPLLRLRGRHRAQLLAKTDSPRAFASRAAAVLARAARRCVGTV
jgi:primosomal protein N'